MEYRRIGSLRTTPVSALAKKAADVLMDIDAPEAFALTVEPPGIVMIEPFDEAVPDEIVGIYDPETLEGEARLMRHRLANQIREDLRAFVRQP